MQFHSNGFRPGDPDLQKAAPGVEDGNRRVLDEVDVLIVGCGPAGLTLAAYLSGFPEITTRIVERKDAPMELGQADGLSCRSMEMFQAFGFAEKIKREAYWVNESTFWNPDPKKQGQITRTGVVDDVEDGLSEMPHVILNQARVHDRFLEVMRNSATRLEPDYDRKFLGLEIDQNAEHPVTVKLGHGSAVETVKAKYVVGCDGARSAVRSAIGRELKGDRADQAWGVMDVLCVTDFPDFRKKSLIKSDGQGNIILIPREGGHLGRFYVELDMVKDGNRLNAKDISLEQLIERANNILHPYSIDVKEVPWWSVYEVGHSLTDKFDDVPAENTAHQLPHVFIAGDACHTHSAKAGQGMNVSMGDTFNLGWKLASVLLGRSAPELLHSYSAERQKVAQDLINFDHEWSRIMGATVEMAKSDFQTYFIEHGRFTAGVSVKYAPSALTGDADHQHLAKGFEIGTRFHSAPVIRLADAKPMHLGHCVLADARWRVFTFAGLGDPFAPNAEFSKLMKFLAEDPNSPIRQLTPSGANLDAVIDLRAIFQQPHRELDISALPSILTPRVGQYGLKDYEKAFCPDQSDDIFDQRGIDRKKGCIVVVRPDQYVAHILPITAHSELAAFFAGTMIAQA